MLRRTVCVLISVILLTLVSAIPAQADCYTYLYSVIYHFAPYEYACIGGGSVCRECGNYNNGGYGYYVCYDNGPGSPGVYCVDYQGTMGWGF
ncbi:MAG TPA: hypothetical protein VGS22_18395 [Thermoanaerobaculia bacterium]|jgi:hypothetical protein|nr:hypothetical protein [Thermoanaerobaculia bacterium]